jgi:hypothetical protein
VCPIQPEVETKVFETLENFDYQKDVRPATRRLTACISPCTMIAYSYANQEVNCELEQGWFSDTVVFTITRDMTRYHGEYNLDKALDVFRQDSVARGLDVTGARMSISLMERVPDINDPPHMHSANVASYYIPFQALHAQLIENQLLKLGNEAAGTRDPGASPAACLGTHQ